jgi:APA family basic amino acid/polyamine antiporter
MGIHRQLPDKLRELHPKFGTPWIGILIFGGLIACLTLIPGQAVFLGNMYAFGAMLSFTIAHISVIKLRQSQPDAERPYRGPGIIRIAGRALPLFAVVGGIATGLAFLVTVALHPDVAAAGAGWLVLGIVLYVVYRRNQGLDLTTTTKAVVQAQVVDHEAEYESVILALDSSHPYPQGTVATAVKIAARRRRGIHVVVSITVPQSAPIDARLPAQELNAQGILEQARLQGGRQVTGHVQKVRPGGTARLILTEARQLRAQAVVMPMPPRVSGSSQFGKTIEAVLANRPCRVIIQSEPARAKARV